MSMEMFKNFKKTPFMTKVGLKTVKTSFVEVWRHDVPTCQSLHHSRQWNGFNDVMTQPGTKETSFNGYETC